MVNKMNKTLTNEEKADTFFRARFSHNFDSEGNLYPYAKYYYQEWIDRFNSGKPELYMDSKSLEVYNNLKEKYGW